MEGQSSTGNSQYQYQSAQWSRLVRRNTLVDSSPNLSSSIALAPQLPTQLDLLPILLPQQSSYHQAQLAQYNRLISSGRTPRLQSPPLPPLLSAQHIQAVPGSRSCSSGSNTAPNNRSSRGGHGNKEARKFSKGERALITERENPTTMPAKKPELSSQLPTRPLPQHQISTLSHQSSSVPSTPHQHARKFSFESREPSPNTTNSHSPRSAYSESNITLPSSRPLLPPARGGCRYETAMAHTRRRMPYSIGSERLERLNAADIKSKLSENEERKLTTDMRELYDRLLPTTESEDKRKKLVQKLEKLFNDEWPGHDIRVHVFGSSGNLLCTDESDVDICITTDWKELEGVCMIAHLLAKSGMKNVICVSTAKVPIVKILDPELGLACDMNVNNTMALENTRMIKTYVEIDPRVRPLAMIVKYWTKRRIVNDAAFGGTLSSYTWICMIINFLQTRNPPILPALHQRPHLKLPPTEGVESSFADDLDALRDFGRKNEESLGELLCGFFRFYGHEFDYDKWVISVRNGKQISKVEKKWHLANNNTLCVEEPFNISRNLGNTADDTSFRGLHMELRRAFDLVREAKLEECCEEYEFPKEEKPNRERPAAKSKPAIIRSASQSNTTRGGRGAGHRGSRQGNQRNSTNRRASSGAFDTNPGYIPGLPPNLTTQDTWLQAQAQAQLHNDLYNTYSVLQAQENSLRLQLFNQSQAFLQAQAQSQNQAYAQSQTRSRGNSTVNQQATDRNRTNSFDQPPLTAPNAPELYFYPLHYNATPIYGYQSSSTNPSSPSMSSAAPELRRSMHRSSVPNGLGLASSSMRSHSQPATRSAPSPLSVPGAAMASSGLGIYQQYRQANGVPIPNFIADENSESGLETPTESLSMTPPEENTPKEYVGYYVNGSAPAPMHRASAVPMAIPTFGDIQQTRRRLSTDQLPQSILNRLKRTSRSPSPLGHDRSYSIGAQSAPIAAVSSLQGASTTSLRALNNQGPLVANGSNVPSPISIPNWQASLSEGSTSGDPFSDTAVGSMDSSSHLSVAGSDVSADQALSKMTPKDLRSDGLMRPPGVVNGSTSQQNELSPPFSSAPTANEVSSHQPGTSNGPLPEKFNGLPRQSPNTQNRLARQGMNGVISPLDIGNEISREDLRHLSPVFESRTPSPTANRKYASEKEEKSETSHFGSRFGPEIVNQIKQAAGETKPNGHTRAAKSEGSPGSWQKISKSKKKGPSTELKSAPNGQPQIERQPSNDSERKGG